MLYYLAVPTDFKRNTVIRYVTVWTTVLLFVVIDDLPTDYTSLRIFFSTDKHRQETTLRTGNTVAYKWDFVHKC